MKNRYPLSDSSKINSGFFIRVLAVLFFIATLNPATRSFAQEQDNTAKNNAAHETENRLKKAANKYFEEENFIEAYPLYSQLLSLYPRDPNYNYRFGACMLFTKADKNKAVEYLSFSIKQPDVDDLAFYYLGRALHLNYRFNEAIRTYRRFEQIASPSELKKYPVRHYIEMCVNGKELISNLHGLDVMRKKELNLSDYFEAYDMHANGGTLLSEPESFKTKVDKDKNVTNVIYLTPDKKHAYFSSYGSSDKNGKDIYVVSRNPDGTWGTPENLGSVINSSFDEDYPVYDTRRHILYFCSKGHNSMGGYDIFKSAYDNVTQKWSEPVNLDFPINTPDDDILFVPDTAGQTAFFSSTRSSPQGTIDVYKIAINIHPPESMVISGNATSDGGKTAIVCKITVKNTKTDEIVGTYMSSPDDGKYSITLPNGGSYSFSVEASNQKTQSQPVVLPVTENMGTMKQNIQFDQSGNLQIKNQVTEVPKDSDYQLAFNFIKDQAKMDVNVDTNSIQTLIAQDAALHASNSNITTGGGSNGNNSQNGGNPSSGSAVSGNGNSNNANPNSTESVTQLAREETALNDKAAKAIDYASDKMEEAQQMQEHASEILKNPAMNGTSGSNQDSVSTANMLIYQSKGSEDKGIEAYQLAAGYKSEAAAKQIEIDRQNNSTNSGQTENGTQTSGNNTSEASTTRVSPGDLVRRQAEQVKEDSFQVARTNDDLVQEVAGLQQKSQEYISEADKTTDTQQKTALLQQAEDLKKSKDEKQEEINENNNALQQMHQENSWLNSKAQKADSGYSASVNGGSDNTNNTVNPSTGPALQQEIDEYTVSHKYNYDSVATDDKIADNYPGEGSNSGNNSNGSISKKSNGGSNHAKHSRYTRNIHHPAKSNNATASTSQSGNTDNTTSASTITSGTPNTIAATNNNAPNTAGNNSTAGNNRNQVNSNNNQNNNSASNVSNNGATNNTQPSNNNNTTSVNGNNTTSGNRQLAGNNGSDQNSQSANNGNATSVNGNNANNGNPQTVGNNNGNQNSQSANNNNTASVNGNNTTSGNLQTAGNNGSNQNSQSGNNGNTTSVNGNNTTSGNPQTAGNNSGNQNSQTANNNATSLNGNNTTSGNPQTAGNDGSNQNSQSGNNGNTASVNGNNTTGGNPQMGGNNSGNQNSQGANNGNTASVNGNNNSNGNPQTAGSNNGNQNSQSGNNNNTTSVNGNNASGGNSQMAGNNNQNSQSGNNNNTTSVNGNNATSGNPQTTGNNGSNQNSLAANNGNTTSVNGNNSSSGNPQTAGNNGSNQNSQSANNGNTTSVNGNNSTVGNPQVNNSQGSNNNSIAGNQSSNQSSGNNGSTSNNNAQGNSNITGVASTNGNRNKKNTINPSTTSNNSQGNNAGNSTRNNNSETSSVNSNSANNPSTGNNSQGTTEVTSANSGNVQNSNGGVSSGLPADSNSKATGNQLSIPATLGYKKTRTPHDALLDSLANAVPKPKTADSHSAKKPKSQGAISVTTVQYTDTAAAGLSQKAQNYFTAAASLVDNAEKIRSKAQGEKDKSKSEVLYNKADSLDDLIFQLNLKGDETIAEANYRQYYTNLDQIEGINVNADKAQVYKVTAAKRLLKDAENSYKRSMSEKDRANNTLVLASKHTYIKSAKQDLATAILRQQSAVYLYFQVDSDQTASTIGKSNSDSSMHFTYSDYMKNKSNKSVKHSRHLFNDNSGNGDEGDSSGTASANNTTIKKATGSTKGSTQAGNSSNTNDNITASSAATPRTSSTSRKKTREKNTGKATANSTNTSTKAETSSAGVATNNTSARIAAPDTLSANGNIFEEVHRSPYSASNPIPIDPPLPMGLIFKVQVGAFKNAIPQNLFQGFQPIIGLSAPEGYIRYSAGLFRAFDIAKDALGKIRGLGYPDAFLIAFFDGKRIPIAEALAKLGITPPPVVAANNGQNTTDNGGNTNNPSVTNNSKSNGGNTNQPAVKGKRKRKKNKGSGAEAGNNVASSGDNKIEIIGENTITPTKKALIDDRKRADKKIKDTIPPNAKSIRDVKGLVYTVQVGSFPKHKDFTRLKRLKQLYTSVDENGAIKYSCGTYSSMTEAKAAKDIIMANSLAKDAFITAYENGKRISLTRADELLHKAAGGTEQQTSDNASGTKSSGTENSNTAIADNKSDNADVTEADNAKEDKNGGKEDNGSFEEASKTKVIYTVQIASFTGELPLDIANKILMYADEGIEPHSEKHGVTSYYAGKYTDYESANTLQQKLYNEGFKQAVIIAYYQGKKISLQQAQSILNK